MLAVVLLAVRHRTPFTKPNETFCERMEIARYPILEVSGFTVYNAHFECTHVGDMKRTRKVVTMWKARPENIPLVKHLDDHPGRVQQLFCSLCLHHGYQLCQHGCSGQSTAYYSKIEALGFQFS